MVSCMICVALGVTMLQAAQPLLKAPSEKIAAREAQVRRWLIDGLPKSKELIREHLGHLFPAALIPMIFAYVYPSYSKYSYTVNVGSWVQHQGFHYPLASVAIDVPLCDEVVENGTYCFKLYYQDVLKGYNALFNDSIDSDRWSQHMGKKKLKARFAKKLLKVNTIQCAMTPKEYEPIGSMDITLATLDHWPLEIYWQNEDKLLTRTNIITGNSIERAKLGSAINAACMVLLKAHNKIASDVQPADLAIFCTVCAGEITKPGDTILSLVWEWSESEDPVYCSKASSLCRVYRPLRVFLQGNNPHVPKRKRKRN